MEVEGKLAGRGFATFKSVRERWLQEGKLGRRK